MENLVLIGNTLEETAYHEAGHIVVAGAVGLALKPMGIQIWEVSGLGDGLACYWEDEKDWGKNLLALRAGQVAQFRQFPESDFRGSQPDVKKFSNIVADHFGDNRCGEMRIEITAKVHRVLDIHWAPVIAVSEALVEGEWIPVDDSEHPSAKRKKHLDGMRLQQFLEHTGFRHKCAMQLQRT